MADYPEKENQDIGTSPQPPIAAEGERGLTPRRKKILEETMRRHDKALKMLANM